MKQCCKNCQHYFYWNHNYLCDIYNLKQAPDFFCSHYEFKDLERGKIFLDIEKPGTIMLARFKGKDYGDYRLSKARLKELINQYGKYVGYEKALSALNHQLYLEDEK